MNDLILDYCCWHKSFCCQAKVTSPSKKKVVVTEATIRDALHLDDAEGVDCLPNEEIFATLACMGYEKPSTKLTFYKAFFSSQWKFIILIIKNQLGDLSTHSTKYISPALTQKPENQGNAEEQGDEEEQGTAAEEPGTAAEEPFTAADVNDDQSIPSPTPLTLLPQQPQDIPSTSQVKKLERANKVKTVKLRRLRKVRTSQRIESSADTIIEDVSNQGRMSKELDKDEGAKVADIYHINMDHAAKVLSMQEDEPKIQEAMEVVTMAKLITKFVAAVSETVSAAVVVQADIPTALVNAAAVMTTVAPVKSKEQIEEEEESREIALINETPAQIAAKRRRLNKEAKDVEELKQHLEIMPDEDDDVFTEATPLARKVPVVDY
nr:hypothetical protein [Tanacetum cinerariifolium]